MPLQENEPRYNGNIADVLQDERVSHPVITWAEAVLANSNSPQLRGAVVDRYPDLPTTMQKGGFWVHREYAKTHDWADIEPGLTRIALGLTAAGTDTMPQKEVVGLAYLVHDAVGGVTGASGNGAFYPLGITVYTLEYKGRLDWSEDFRDSEDWLEALGNIVRVQNRQVEAQAKDQVTVSSSVRLSTLQNRVGIGDIEQVYADIVRAVRPKAQLVQTFRQGENDFDGPLQIAIFLHGIGNQELVSYIGSRSAADRRRAVVCFLSQYNYHLDEASGREKEALAWIFGTYLSIHPHPDYNGTMIRILINGYLLKRSLGPIDWSVIRQDPAAESELNKGRHEFAFRDNPYSLKRWFGEHVEGLTSK